jgi:precorrin-8X/cobalt-precorrin-8 methylmutase
LYNSIVIIGNAPTALFRLLEMLESGDDKPALVIGMPVGFVGAPESKDYLWNHRAELGLECITLQGRVGGSALAAGAFNTLMRLKNGLRF